MNKLESLFLLSRTVLVSLVALTVWGNRASAQCPVPDGLDGGPCCAQAVENVPYFKKVVQNSLDICWRDCGIEAVGPCVAKWAPHKILSSNGLTNCGYRTSQLTLSDTAGTVKWSGIMRLLYARTWLETDTAGLPVQVWRFLVNGDLRPTAAAGLPPCPVPACAPLFNRVRVSGYIDYAQTCVAAGAVPEIAWMLTHACDVIDHAPGFPRAGAFHPGRSFSFVGPAAGFVPAPLVAMEGTAFSPFETVRQVRYPVPGVPPGIRCVFEERFQHSLATTQFCLCNVGPPLSAQWMIGNLNGTGGCGTTITTPGGPFLPGFLSMGIGSWTIPTAYPGTEDLRWNAGNYDYGEPCAGVLRNEVFYGVTTIGGYPARQLLAGGPGAPLPPVFIDQANSLSSGAGVTIMNVPYRSDHIVNLNH